MFETENSRPLIWQVMKAWVNSDIVCCYSGMRKQKRKRDKKQTERNKHLHVYFIMLERLHEI